MYHVAATPNPSFETSFDTSTTFSVSEFPTDTNVSSPTEAFPVTQFSEDTNLSLIPAGEVVVSRPRNQIQTPPNSKRKATTTSISPLVFRLPQETATNLKKLRPGTELNISVVAWISYLHKRKWPPQTLMGNEKKENWLKHELISLNVS